MLRKTLSRGIVFLSMTMMAFFSFTSCRQNNNTAPSTNTAKLQLYLTDDPGDYQAAWVDIQKILVQVAPDSSQSQQSAKWVEVPGFKAGLYDILRYRNGDDTMLAAVNVPAGTVSMIKLVFGENSKLILKDGRSVALEAPTFIKSDVKLVVEGTARTSGPAYNLVLDFDISRSIINAGARDSLSYLFIPYVRAFPKEAGGAIEGWVFPDSARAHIVAISDADDTVTTIPDPNGYYKLWGIPAGTYDLSFLADHSTGYQNGSLHEVQITNGQLLTADTVWLHK